MLVTDLSQPDLQGSSLKDDSEKGLPPTLSTFAGNPCRGGWIPIYAKPLFGSPVLVDWKCPICCSLTSQSRTCPRCGLEKQEIPIYKDLSRPEREHKSKYSLWMAEQLGYDPLRRGFQEDHKPKADSEPKSNTASNRRREAHATSRY
jgi:hypothetical protein